MLIGICSDLVWRIAHWNVQQSRPGIREREVGEQRRGSFISRPSRPRSQFQPASRRNQTDEELACPRPGVPVAREGRRGSDAADGKFKIHPFDVISERDGTFARSSVSLGANYPRPATDSMKKEEPGEHGFDRVTVESHAPDRYGVYTLFRGDKCIYVGRGIVREKLLGHLAGNDPCIARQKPTLWYSITSSANLPGLQTLLIGELKPLCREEPPSAGA